MQINKLFPQGYCKGVIEALKIVEEASNNNNLPKPIYILGKIINNKYITNELNKKGIISIDSKNKTRLELLDEIDSGTVIFSAHGVSNKVREKAFKKGLYIIDASCKVVLGIQNTILEYLDNKFEVIYIGTKNHPECEGVLGLSENIHFIDNTDDIIKLNLKSDKIYATNQTTLSNYDINHFYDLILNIYPNAIIENNLCKATTLRQKAVMEQPNADLLIVVGDTLSSNSLKLASISEKNAKIKSILIENVSDLENYDFSNTKSINVTSGASTPKILTDEVINYLKNK